MNLRKNYALCPLVALAIALSQGVVMAQSIKTEGDIETDGQLISNVPAGTPPLVTPSLGWVENLNADCLDGLHWWDFATRTEFSGYSATADCLEGLLDGRVLTETEPNDSIEAADRICFGQASGMVDIGDDFFSRSEVQAGDLVFAYVDAFATGTAPLGTGDSELTVLLNDGTVLETDDWDGPDETSVVAGAVIPPGQSGKVTYKVNEHGRDDLIVFRLYEVVTSASQAETEPNDDFASADPLKHPAVVTGVVLVTGVDYFAFFAPAGARIVVMADDDPDDDMNLTDTGLEIYAPDQVTKLADGDNFYTRDGNAAVADSVNGGIHYLKITNGSTTMDTDYRFVVRVYPGQGLVG